MRMNRRRFPLAVIALSAALGSGACLTERTPTGSNGGLPPDTLPLSIADSTLSFSIETSAMFSADSQRVFFTIRNNATTTRPVQGSSSCTFTVRAYSLSGAVVSPIAPQVCTADLVTWATLAPGEVITIERRWKATDGNGSSAIGLPTGTYELEARLEATNFQRTSRRLKIQVVKR
jgi:hypothetical protein